MCPNFHCNLTEGFTFNCCSKHSWIIIKLICSFFTVTSTLDCIRQLSVNRPVRLHTVESGTQQKLYIFAVYVLQICVRWSSESNFFCQTRPNLPIPLHKSSIHAYNLVCNGFWLILALLAQIWSKVRLKILILNVPGSQ